MTQARTWIRAWRALSLLRGSLLRCALLVLAGVEASGGRLVVGVRRNVAVELERCEVESWMSYSAGDAAGVVIEVQLYRSSAHTTVGIQAGPDTVAVVICSLLISVLISCDACAGL